MYYTISMYQTAIEIPRALGSVYGEDIMPRPIVSRWCQPFFDERTTVHHQPRSAPQNHKELRVDAGLQFYQFCDVTG